LVGELIFNFMFVNLGSGLDQVSKD
jgi:hypothetical protein